MDEADRREQLRAAVRAAKQESWENLVEQAANRPPQPTPRTSDRENFQLDRHHGQGELIREDGLGKEEITKLGLDLTAAAAAAVHIPHAEEFHQAVNNSTPLGTDDALLLAQNARMRIQELKQAAKHEQKQIRGQMEERRYPAQRNEQGLVDRKEVPMTRMCSLGDGVPATRIIEQIQLEGHETMSDVAVCDGHGQALYNHEPEKFRAAGGSKEAVEKFRPYVKDTNTKLVHSRRPERPRERHEIERSLGLERDRGSEGRTL